MTTPMTDHANLARENLDAVHDWQEREGETDASMLTVAIDAQVHATLALVEEQRTANLISLATRGVDIRTPALVSTHWHPILVRLGLTLTTPNQEQP